MNARTELEAFGEPMSLRVPPHSAEAEMALLGGLMLETGLWDVVSDIVTEADFYRHENRLVWGAIASLAAACKEADVIAVHAELTRRGKAEECGGLAYIGSLAQFQPAARSMRGYAQTIRERAMARKLITAADEISSAAFEQSMPVAERIEQATSQLAKLLEGAQSDEWQDVGAGLVELLERLQDQAEGKQQDFVPTGIKTIDDRLDGGMRPGELVVIGARPSMGKSALSLTIAANVAEQGKAVGIFSMEMPRQQVYGRLLAMKSLVHLARIKRPERLGEAGWSDLSRATESLSRQPVSVCDQSGLTITQVRTKTRALRRRMQDLRVIVVDYLGLMSGQDPKMPRAYQLEEVTKGLKALAKELGISVILLVQLNRKVEERIDQMPILSDIRDAGSVEQDADIIMFLHRPFKADPAIGEEWKYYAKGSIAKLRDGEPGYFDLMYIGENTRFKDWPDTVPRPIAAGSKSKGKTL